MLKKGLVLILAAALLAGCSDSKSSDGPPPPAPETLGTWRDTGDVFMTNFALTTTDDCNGFAVNDKGVAVHIFRVDEDGKMYQVETVKGAEIVFVEIGKVEGNNFIPTPEFTTEFLGFDPASVMGSAGTATTTFTLSVNNGAMTVTPTVTYTAGKDKNATINLPAKNLSGVSPEAGDMLLNKAAACSSLKGV